MIKIPSLKEISNKIKKFLLTVCKRAFFFSAGKSRGSMALEGSLVLPIFLFFMMTVLLSLEAVRFQCNMQEALFVSGNNRAFAEYQVKYAMRERTEIKGQVKKYLGNQIYPYLCVKNGENGINLQDLSDKNKIGFIEVTAEYKLKPFIYWLPIGEITIKDRFFSHAWVGYSGSAIQNGEDREIYVYITKTGGKYHLTYDCTYLRVKIQAVGYEGISSLRNTSGGRYYACERCKPEGNGIVYIAADGNRYHGEADCPSLKRIVYMVPLSEAKGYSVCSKCGG